LLRAGVSKKTLYKYFPNKEDLVVSMIVRAMHRGKESIGEADPSFPQ
jgi:AcrR family transcriptional regulator